ncbi:uncharacterized protein LOC110057138 [Orbicella faveolata]|uniref:uncharacterized protein LOC110057138 n=1 Tax=Orbicella faveolata TaxID=48498 RepID=UPI0009E5BA17|nr:uncharacterized protein LOC110057138 [Orbicella faveolata]
MHTSNTLNNRSATYDALSLVPESKEIPPPPVSMPLDSSVASTALSTIPSSVLSPTSLAFLAAVANAVQQVPSAQPVASHPNSSSSMSVAISRGVSAPLANPSQLVAQALSFAASGVGFASSPPAKATPLASGRPNYFVVPTLVSTFSTPIPSLALSASSSTVNAAFPLSAVRATPLALLPVLHQPFVVGPGFSPVPAKLVSQIVAGRFVELHELLPFNIVLTEPEPQLLFDGRLVLTSLPKKPKRRIEDISTSLKAFSVYCLIIVLYFPHRWRDLLQYQLLILRTYCQFSGWVWLSYDRTFRENAAATNLTDWSQLNSTLFSFHSAGWSSRSPRDSLDGQTEPRGAASSQIICKSWNRSHCVASSASCRFAHKCASCHDPHHAGVCPAETPTKPSSSSKRSPDSLPPWSSSKSRCV